MTGRFAGQTAIITGVSRGIGLVIAERLVADGGEVVVTGRRPTLWPRQLDPAAHAAGPRARHGPRMGREYAVISA
ncbi:NAD(P)-dependent dehydrogenase (short-subunit alcohol dehydrogenase family) [Streptomyces sp. V4I23]|uniref:SDR family NAD(P)-dependent oxidoreductase n=1 Tax=Streptomyces sp. V4I23 TaxID=3042282 RepID=UPI002783338B|nr:SDR family NAD(P)-dependent oxidoreductase [Streptomyces sp. V4I23]MDQ1006889.1 NAD(P)-dependent dehydrogenase (short-subunit alcohol dehydrogenase family) [Streptomyces sp. V4I23]